MTEDTKDLRDAYWKLYQEHSTHLRHHENQRSTVASSILAIASILIGLVTFDRSIVLTDLPLTILLTCIGIFGALFSAKQYERASMHTERARRYRDAVDETLKGQPLKRLKREADQVHNNDFLYLEKLRLNKFWVGLYIVIVAIGFTLSTIAVFSPQAIG